MKRVPGFLLVSHETGVWFHETSFWLHETRFWFHETRFGYENLGIGETHEIHGIRGILIFVTLRMTQGRDLVC